MKEAKPAAPVVEANPANASVSVTPTGEVDKVKVTFTPTDGTTEKTIEIAKEDGVWKDKSNTPGVTVNPTTGLVTLDHTVAKDGTAVKAVATKGNSDASNEGTANDPTKVYILKGEPAREFEIEIPLPLVVSNPEDLTPDEKTELEKKVKKSNPNMDVKVDDKGNVTITNSKIGQSKVIPVKDLTVKDFTPVKPDKVPVKDKAHLTSEEKKQVVDKVKAKNPGKEVTVGDDGTATVKDPTTGISHTIPGTDLVNQDFEPVKPDEKVPAKDKDHLTQEEKKQVADKVKAKNPGKEVTVGDDGTATVKDPTTGISHTIPGTDLVNQDFEPVKPTEKVPVKDKAHLTPEEKKQVADKVKAKNPGKEVTVGDDGTATVKDPTTGISHIIPGTDLVNQDFEPVKPTDKVPVKDVNNLSKDERDKVKKSVEKVNPGKTVEVEPTGKITITDPVTKISHELSGEEVTTILPPVLEMPEYTEPIGTTGVDKNGNIILPPVEEIPEFVGGVNGELSEPIELPKVKLIITKWTDEADNELKSADVKVPAVLGEANEALEAGEIVGYEFVRTEHSVNGEVVTHIFRKVALIKPEGNKEETNGDQRQHPSVIPSTTDTSITPSSTAKVEKSTKRLANTGEAETNTGLAGIGLGILGSLLAVAKRRRKDEE